MDPMCAKKLAVLAIEHPKCHEHTLAFFPRQQVSFTCDACALGNDGFPVYVCLPCDFMVHRDCIYLPRVIKISRHQHRISHTYALPPVKLSCGVCRRAVNDDYGGYSCTKGCSNYVVHSKCATRKNTWDGKELEGVPEDADALGDVDLFEKIGDGIIRHFSHGHHHLRLERESSVYDANKLCQACTLPIHHDGDFYSCKQCDFFLHERCANLPRRLQHPLDPHPLTLHIDNISDEPLGMEGSFMCCTCFRRCCGFMYKCPDEKCYFKLKLDVRCASASEPFVFGGHPHSLFLTSDTDTKSTCKVCRSEGRNMLHCTECNFVLCFWCAALPHRVRYKYDKHLLTFRYGEHATGELCWCEVCESKVDQGEMLYTCDECCITLHIDCVLGERSEYVKPGHTLVEYSLKYEILPNNHISRPICKKCSRRCQYNVALKHLPTQEIFCSFSCLTWAID